MASSSTYFDPASYVQGQAAQNAAGSGQLSGYDSSRTGQAGGQAPSPSGLGDSSTGGQYTGLNMAINQALDPGSEYSLLRGQQGATVAPAPAAPSYAGGGAPSGSSAGTRSTISQIASQLGVPANVAIAMAQEESGLNPNSVGDNGTSFGLYNLHQGGELGSMSPQSVLGVGGEALNARTALGELSSVMRAHPGMDPGQAAAMAQRPANQAAYAAAIDNLIRQGY